MEKKIYVDSLVFLKKYSWNKKMLKKNAMTRAENYI